MAGTNPSYGDSATIDWTRYVWIDTTSAGRHVSSDGFTIQPSWIPRVPGDYFIGDQQHRSALPPLTSLAGLEDVQICAVIAERGGGKSTLFAAEHRRHCRGGQPSALIDLRRVASASMLSDDLAAARRSLRNQAYAEGAHGGPVHLYVDLDEGLSADSCSRVLGRALPGLQEEFGRRLRLRISCRPPSWSVYADALKRDLHASDAAVPEVFLAPLCAEDVEYAARTFGLDPEAVLQTVYERGIGPIAARPVTLFMLLNRLRDGSRIPQTLSELMDEAVAGLCRRPPAQADAIAPRHLALAVRRVAAGLHLSGSAVLGLQDADGESLALQDLLGTEPDSGANVHIDWALAKAAADTGVFTATGTTTLALAHQIYADHLTRQWLASRELSPGQLIDIVTSEGRDGQRRVVPRLSELAAMLASTIPSVFDNLLHVDPTVLLRCDQQTLGDAERASVVSALLDLDDDTGVFDSGAHLLAPLSCPAVVRVVGQALSADDPSRLIRGCRIAARLGERELNAALLELATDSAQCSRVRIAAADALVVPLGGEHSALLAAAVIEPHVDGEVLSSLLTAGWPGGLDIEFVIAQLDRLINDVKADLWSSGVPPLLLHAAGTDDLIVLLGWATAKPEEAPRRPGWLSIQCERFASEITAELLIRFLNEENQDLEAVLVPALADSCLGLFGLPSAVNSVLRAVPLLRRRLGPAALAAVSDKQVADSLLHLTSIAVIPDDLDWLVEFIAAEPPERRLSWSRRLVKDADLDDQELFAALWATGEQLPDVAAWLHKRCQIQIDDRRHDPENTRPEPALSPRAAYLPIEENSAESTFSARTLAAALSSDQPLLKRWDAVSEALPRRCDDVVEVAGDPVGSTLRRVPHDLRSAVVDLAQEVIFTLPTNVRTAIAQSFDDPDEARFFWHIDHHVMAGNAAWTVCFGARPEMAALVPTAVASEWLRIMLYYHEDCYSEGDLDMPRRAIAALISNLGAAEAASVIVEEISVLAPRYVDPTAIEILQDSWQPQTVQAVIDRLGSASSECVRALLKPLLAKGSPPAVELATSTLTDESCTPNRRGFVAQAMLFSQDTCSTAIEALLRDESLTRIALRHLNCNHDGESSRWPPPVALQAPELLGRLYQHLNRLYPEDDNMDAMEEDYSQRELRRELPDLITRRGEWPAVRVLSELAETGAGANWPQMVNRAARTALDKDYRGWPLTVLEQLATDPRHRIVDSSAQLLTVIVEALEAFHAELHGDIPLVSSLWDQTGTGRATFKPKNEAKLSDEIARWLRHSLAGSGIVVNREVQVRRLRESAQSESADIVVQAAAAGGRGGTATVIIEVKGGWNRETLSAMRSQLAERYLAAQPEAVGLYVVGWYLCPEWDPDDRGRRTAHRSLGSISSLRSELGSQARGMAGQRLHPQVLDLRLSPRRPENGQQT